MTSEVIFKVKIIYDSGEHNFNFDNLTELSPVRCQMSISVSVINMDMLNSKASMSLKVGDICNLFGCYTCIKILFKNIKLQKLKKNNNLSLIIYLLIQFGYSSFHQSDDNLTVIT